ncbi:LysE family transporter [Aquibium sp. A9E412]|uniref:LysE family translocator n=1 Tax=Aquibium sp. A9E412 TaxID=2976767 RepID=UPI0025B03795|nr:LysE family transporter [Aquibium sp. A9E412]MDN2566571.1 LysE family transporter [Aquibium sp. A9E412]
MIEVYALTLLGVALAQAAPGPNFLAVVGAALGRGRRAALMTVLGVSTGMLVWAVLVAFGLAAALALFPPLMTAMKLLGGGYLLFLAVRAALKAGAGGTAAVPSAGARGSDFADWRRGLLVVVTNPKAALMWAAVGAFLFGAGLDGWQVVAFGPLAALSALLVYGVSAFAFSAGFAMRSYRRFSRWIETAFAAAFGALGATLLYGGLREAGGRG